MKNHNVKKKIKLAALLSVLSFMSGDVHKKGSLAAASFTKKDICNIVFHTQQVCFFGRACPGLWLLPCLVSNNNMPKIYLFCRFLTVLFVLSLNKKQSRQYPFATAGSIMYSTGDVLHTVHALNSRKIVCILYIGTKKGKKTDILRRNPRRWSRKCTLCGA